MDGEDDLPWTPDFEQYSNRIALRRAEVGDGSIQLFWADGRSNHFDVFLLRENSAEYLLYAVYYRKKSNEPERRVVAVKKQTVEKMEVVGNSFIFRY